MKKFHVNYCDKGNTSELHTAETLDAAKIFADQFVKGKQEVGPEVDPDTDTADIFHIEVWSYDATTDNDPELEYTTAYYFV